MSKIYITRDRSEVYESGSPKTNRNKYIIVGVVILLIIVGSLLTYFLYPSTTVTGSDTSGVLTEFEKFTSSLKKLLPNEVYIGYFTKSSLGLKVVQSESSSFHECKTTYSVLDVLTSDVFYMELTLLADMSPELVEGSYQRFGVSLYEGTIDSSKSVRMFVEYNIEVGIETTFTIYSVTNDGSPEVIFPTTSIPSIPLTIGFLLNIGTGQYGVLFQGAVYLSSTTFTDLDVESLVPAVYLDKKVDGSAVTFDLDVNVGQKTFVRTTSLITDLFPTKKIRSVM